MKILVNDRQIELADGANIVQMLEAANITTAGIAVAIDGTVVNRDCWDSTRLTDGAKVIIVKAYFGG